MRDSVTGVSVAIVATLLFPLSVIASPDDVRSAAAHIAQAYAIGDAAAFEARRTRVDVEEAARIDCNELKGVTIDSVSGDDAATIVRATIVRANPSRTESKHLVLTLRRENDRWRLVDTAIAERALARQLAADPARWDALTRDEPELIDRDLIITLGDMAAIGTGLVRAAEARGAVAALNNIAESLGMTSARAMAAIAEASVADLGGNPARARERIDVAMPLARQSGDPELLMRALMTESRIVERTPNGYPRAVELSEEALRLSDRVANPLLTAFITGNIGNLKLKQAKYAEALRYFERAAAMSRRIDDVAGIMKVESATGLLLQIEGNDELALVHMRRADELGASDPTNDVWRGQNFISMAQSLTALGSDRESDEVLQKAGELGRKTKAPIVVGETHRLLGSSLRRKHDYAAATRELEEALSVFEAAKRIHFIPGAMSELALTRLEAGDAKDALARAERCAETSRKVNEDLPYIECRTFAGEAHRALGESDAALEAFKDAIDASEERRRVLVGDARQRAHFLDRVISPYLDAADLLAGRGDDAGALDMVEQAKSRALLDILGADVSHAPKVLTPQEEQRNNELASRLATLNRRLRDQTSKPPAELAQQVAAARAEYESYQLVLDAAHPRRMALEGDVPVAKREDLAPILGKSTAIVEYVVAADRVRAFVITSDRVMSFALKTNGRDLDPIIARFSDALASADLGYRDDAKTLYTLLLQPLEKALQGRKAVCVVPDGSLWRLPFEALVDRQGRFVVESRAVYYAPSMSVLAQVTRGGERAKESPSTMLLAIGNPTVGGEAAAKLRGLDLGPIKEAEAEVRALRSLYGAPRSVVYVGSEATKKKVTSEMDRARVLHFATHARLDEQNPMYSEVVLAESGDASDDGLLAAWEIMRLNLHADIVVLSACDTARGHLTAGEGVIGFTWALFAAGCPSSVVSEWKVASTSTKQLMVAFHRALLASHDPSLAKAEALRTAKLSLLRDPRTKHPFYWSAFVLVGSARTSR